MKLFAIILFFYFFGFASLQSQDKSTNTLPEKSINYGIDRTYEPYEFINDAGNPDGFNVDIIKAIGEELNWNISIYADDWKEVRQKLEVEKGLDVATYFKTTGREDTISFSRPISLVYYTIFTRSDQEPVEDLIALSGKKVAIQEATIVSEYFDQLGFLDLKFLQTYPSESAALDAVVNGKADCAITSFMTTNYKMEVENITDIQSSSDPVFITEYCFVVSNQNLQLLDSLNWGIRLIKASGEYDNIYQKWLSPKKDWWIKYQEILTASFIILFIVVISISIYIAVLRRSVERKTGQIQREATSRAQAEWELIESENLRRKMEAFTSVILLETDLENNIIRAPKLFYSILGFEEDELKGVNVHQLLTAKSAKNDKEIKQVLMNKELPYLDTEYEFKSVSNIPVWMEGSTSLLYNDKQKIIGFKQFLRDITAIKKANVTLKDLNAELANFMYKTSHDVRGPIANVLGLANIGKMSTTDDELANYFNLIEKSIHKLEQIFNDFKEVSFILHGDLNFTSFSFTELTNEVVESVFLKRNKNVAKAKIEMDILASNDFIISDRALLKRLLLQLIENVFEHNNYYETTLRISLETDMANYYRILVEDNGNGIPDDLQQKVFEVFFKGKRSDINVGMGLYMAKKVTNRLDGELSLDSEVGKGTSFKIILPIHKRAKNLI